MTRRCRTILSLVVPMLAFGQGRVIELKSADVLNGKVMNGEDVRELIGHVHFVQPAAAGGLVRVWCDRALQYLRQNKVELFGHVTILRDSVTITSSEGTYDGNSRRVEVHTGVRLERGRSVLTSVHGEYFSDERRSHFFVNVKLVDSTSTIWCDDMVYFENEATSIAVGHVRVDNTENATTIFGDSLIHFEKLQFTHVLKNPRLIQTDTSGGGQIDTMLVVSKVMESYQDSTQRFVAIDSVKMARGDMSAVCGRAVAYVRKDLVLLQQNPVVWSGDNQVSGDTITVRLKNNALHTVFVRGRAMALSHADSIRRQRFDQLTGRQLTMYFLDGKVNQVDVERNATSLYYLYDDATPNGLNKSSGDRILIDFEEGKVDRIKIIGGVQGQYYPEKSIRRRETDYNLDGFRWLPLRPLRRGLTMTMRHYD